jgi:hypothetical protein
MSDNDDPLPVLGNAEIFAVKHLPLEVIPQFIQRLEDCSKRPAFVVIEEPFDVFKKQIFGSVMLRDSGNFEEESSASVFHTSPLPSDTESLARKAATDKVVGWDVSCGNSGNVSAVDGSGEVFVVGVAGVLIPFV